MAGIYDRADIYDLFDNAERFLEYRKHWETVLQGTGIQSVLDVSIGSGSVTLPLIDLGIALYGSDLSESMLKNCQRKADCKGYTIELKCSDFRNLGCWADKRFDCVASTGNSLPYVENTDVLKTLEQMDSLVKEHGYIYLDVRNWNKILKEKYRFYLYNPIFDGDTRINFLQVWDYNEDESMTFNLLYTFEKNNKIFQKEKFAEHYYPIRQNLIIGKLRELGYADIKIMCFPATADHLDVNSPDWYCILAKKQ